MSTEVVGSEPVAFLKEDDQLLADLFHALSQPLTTLQCALATSVHESRGAARSAHDLRVALAQAESVSRLVNWLRELVEADKPQPLQRLSLTDCLNETVADLLPLAESEGVKLSSVSDSPCMVNFAVGRLWQAVFHLLHFAVNAAGTGADVSVRAWEDDNKVLLAVTTGASDLRAAPGCAERFAGQQPQELEDRVGLAIARRLLDCNGATLVAEQYEDGLSITVCFPGD